MLQELFMWTPIILEQLIVLNLFLRREKHWIQLANHTHLKICIELLINLFIVCRMFLHRNRCFVKTFISGHLNLVLHNFYLVLGTMLS